MEDNKCVHCGADCGKNPVEWNGMKFCCNGCKTVYQLLNEKKLFKYYDIQPMPGIRTEQNEFESKYAYLDREDIQDKIFEFREGAMAKVKFYIPVIHCASCIWLIENLHTLHAGVQSSRVNFIKKEVSITIHTQEISLRQLVELLASIHYTPEVSLQSLETETSDQSDKKLLFKLGVAGFAFGNVMLYSLPEYFNGGVPVEDGLGSFLGVLSYIMTFPVVFYSGQDYLIAAYKNVQKKVITIDLPIALGIIALFLVTSYKVLSGTSGGYSDSLTGLIFFLTLGKYYQSLTYNALSFERDYKSYFPVAVTKWFNGVESSVLLSEILASDVLLIRNKELIPADCVLSEGMALIDYSFVTGESKPVKKEIGEFIYAGGRQTGGAIKVKVEKAVEQSHLTKLWNEDESHKHPKASLSKIVDKVSHYFTIVVLIIALGGAAFWWWHDSIEEAIFIFSAVLIVACPCALAMSIPFTFGNTMRLFGNAGLYLKNVEVIERLHQVDTIVFDKTGTLTHPNVDDIRFVGTSLSEHEKAMVLAMTIPSTHPLSQALAQYYQPHERIEAEQFVEMSGRGSYGMVQQHSLRIGSLSFVDSNHEYKASTSIFSEVHLVIDEMYKGYWEIHNKYREGFEQIIGKLQKNFDLYVLSGDNEAEKSFLEQHFDPTHLMFNQSPQSKRDFIAQLQNKGKVVLMTGDGLNDAGALMQADVALTVADDVYHFSPAGDAILEAKNFSKLYDFKIFTNTSLNIVKVSFTISFMYNVIGIGVALSGWLSPVVAAILMPVSSVSVVAFATFVTRFLGRKLND